MGSEDGCPGGSRKEGRFPRERRLVMRPKLEPNLNDNEGDVYHAPPPRRPSFFST